MVTSRRPQEIPGCVALLDPAEGAVVAAAEVSSWLGAVAVVAVPVGTVALPVVAGMAVVARLQFLFSTLRLL